jgi:hypothetical protein
MTRIFCESLRVQESSSLQPECFCELHTDPARRTPKEYGPLIDVFSSPTVGFVQFIRVLRVRLLFSLDAIEASKPKATSAMTC